MDVQRALLLEDDDFDAAVVRELLENVCQQNFVVDRCENTADAERLMARNDYAVILVDMNLADSHGLSTIRDVVDISAAIPIVVLTGTDDHDIAGQALEIGVQDFLPKSALDNRVLERVIRFAIRRKRKEINLTAMAYYDCLTGLGNRAHLYERWQRSKSRAKRAALNYGVIVIDVNWFKAINDTHGHEAGDLVLQDIAVRLKALVRDSDVVTRLGGDEFVIILENIQSDEDVYTIRDKLMNGPEFSVIMNDKKINYSICAGATISDPDDDEELADALRRADLEMYQFKAVHRQTGEQLQVNAR